MANDDPPNPPDLQSVLARLVEVEAKLEAATAKVEAATAELRRKDQIIEALKHRLFGSSSEKLDPAQLQLELDGALLGKAEAPPENGDAKCAPGEPGKPKGKNRRKKADLFPKNLKVVIDAVLIPEEVLQSPGDFREIGEEHHDEIDGSPATLHWRRTVRKKYVRRDRTQAPLVAPAPEPSLPGTLCAPGLAAQIITDKYCDHLPHYRQSQRFLRQHKAHLSRQTLNGWTHAAARHLGPIGEAIKAELFHASALQVDETPIDYLSPGNGTTKKGYLWTYLANGLGSHHDDSGGTAYYDWQTGRSMDCLKEVMRVDEQTGTTHFKGTLQVDGFSVYPALAKRYGGIRLAGCLAHIRRKFYEARKQDPELVLPILWEIQKLYRIEEQLRTPAATSDCRKLVRMARGRPIVTDLYRTILEAKQHGRHLPKSNLGAALDYALGQWEKFERYLDDGDLEIDNNLVENAIRPTKLGAKNYLFFGSAEAGKNSALLYTLIENCKRQGLDPESYLAEAIKRLPEHPTPEQAAELTPRRIAAERRQGESAAA